MDKEFFGRRPEELAAIVFKDGIIPATEKANATLIRISSTDERQQRETSLDKGIYPADPIQRLILERMVRHYAKTQIFGGENIEVARSFLEGDEASVIFTSNHLSHADGAVINSILHRHGLDPVFVLGKRILDNPPVDFLARAVDCVHVWPPTMIPENEEKEREMYKMNYKATRGSLYTLESGRPLVLFPEGGRTRNNGQLKDDIFDSISGYFEMRRKKPMLVVPVGLIGTDNVLPVEVYKPKKADVKIIFGEPYWAFEIIDAAKNIAGKSKEVKKEQIFIGAMQKIAAVLPEELRGVYKGPVKVELQLVKEEGKPDRMVKKVVPLAA